jgi:hypothetical protein
LAKLVNDMSIARHDRAEECPATCGRLHLVLARNIVFDNERYPMKRTAKVTFKALFIRCGCYSVSIWVEFEDRAREKSV